MARVRPLGAGVGARRAPLHSQDDIASQCSIELFCSWSRHTLIGPHVSTSQKSIFGAPDK
eukprot:366501-Chlamydomonas_euryale.AAC.1